MAHLGRLGHRVPVVLRVRQRPGVDAPGGTQDDRALRHCDRGARLLLGAAPPRRQGRGPRGRAVLLLPDHARERRPHHERHDGHLHVPRGGHRVLGHGPQAYPAAGFRLRPPPRAPLRGQVLGARRGPDLRRALGRAHRRQRDARGGMALPRTRSTGRARRARPRGRHARRVRAGDRGHLGLVRLQVPHVPPVRAQPRALARRLGRPRGPGRSHGRDPAVFARAPPASRVLHLRIRAQLPVFALPEIVSERPVPQHRMGGLLPLHSRREDATRAIRPRGTGRGLRPRAPAGQPASGGSGSTPGRPSSSSWWFIPPSC